MPAAQINGPGTATVPTESNGIAELPSGIPVDDESKMRLSTAF